MKKRVLSVFLVLCLIFTLLPVTASAASTEMMQLGTEMRKSWSSQTYSTMFLLKIGNAGFYDLTIIIARERSMYTLRARSMHNYTPIRILCITLLPTRGQINILKGIYTWQKECMSYIASTGTQVLMHLMRILD